MQYFLRARRAGHSLTFTQAPTLSLMIYKSTRIFAPLSDMCIYICVQRLCLDIMRCWDLRVRGVMWVVGETVLYREMWYLAMSV